MDGQGRIHRRAVWISRPDGHRVFLREPHAPAIAEPRACPGLHRDAGPEVQRRVVSEREPAGVVVTKDIRHDRAGRRRGAAHGLDRFADKHCRPPGFSAPGKRGVCSGKVEKRDLRVAENESRPVRIEISPEAEPPCRELRECFSRTHFPQRDDRRNIERVPEGFADADRAEKAVVVILRIVVRIGATDRLFSIRKQGGRGDDPVLDGFRVEERFQRGAGAARRRGGVDVSVLRKRGRDHRSHSTAGIVHDHGTAGGGTERFQSFSGGFHDPPDHLLKVEIQRAATVGISGSEPGECLAGKMRRIRGQFETPGFRRRG